jgi:hypothetical protein
MNEVANAGASGLLKRIESLIKLAVPADTVEFATSSVLVTLTEQVG